VTFLDLNSKSFFGTIVVLHILILPCCFFQRLLKEINFVICHFELVVSKAILESFNDLVHVHAIV